MSQNRLLRTTSVIVQPVGTQTKPTLSRQAIPPAPHDPVPFSVASLKDPATLHPILSQLHQNTMKTMSALISDPVAPGNVIQGHSFTAGQTLPITHALVRAYTALLAV